ncbi:MAG TPA: DUF4412 domain-containing protein [Bacteroidota bacterium]|nr:DUF4412 domain-containing protein [Bacteroidota bacterium]
MKRVQMHVALVGALLVCLVLPALSQGLYWESTTTGMPMRGGPGGNGGGGNNTGTQNSTFYAMPKMFKAVQDGGRTFIIRMDKQTITSVNAKDSTYWEMSFDDLEKQAAGAGSRMQEMMARMKDRMADMPPDQRAAVEERMKSMGGMGGADSSKLAVEKESDTKTISGFNCTRYEVKRDTASFMTVWATSDVKGSAEMKKDFADFRDRMMKLNPMGGRSAFYGMSEIDGFPIQSEHGDYKNVVTKVEQRNTPESAFQAPDGFKKVQPQMGNGNRQRRRRNSEDDNGGNNDNQDNNNN